MYAPRSAHSYTLSYIPATLHIISFIFPGIGGMYYIFPMLYTSYSSDTEYSICITLFVLWYIGILHSSILPHIRAQFYILYIYIYILYYVICTICNLQLYDPYSIKYRFRVVSRGSSLTANTYDRSCLVEGSFKRAVILPTTIASICSARSRRYQGQFISV